MRKKKKKVIIVENDRSVFIQIAKKFQEHGFSVYPDNPADYFKLKADVLLNMSINADNEKRIKAGDEIIYDFENFIEKDNNVYCIIDYNLFFKDSEASGISFYEKFIKNKVKITFFTVSPDVDFSEVVNFTNKEKKCFFILKDKENKFIFKKIQELIF
ncbi:MAG: hypothetical protein WCX46_02070 [Candidatus Paceibacterota bacterium]